ncbi:MAG: secretin N-terminal domain-containing protein [Trueperaceae bacterium]|nr:secretin N-terminal domain-containing protein [Trueperaceae bacterium]
MIHSVRYTLLCGLLVSAGLLGTALAQPAPLPDDARFRQLVTLQTDIGGESLAAVVTALARSVGLVPVLQGVPDATVNFNIDEPTPFQQVWGIVLSLNDLDYLLQPNDIVIVGTSEQVAKVRLADTETTVRRVYRLDAAQAGVLQSTLQQSGLVQEGEVIVDERTNSLIVTSDVAMQQEIAELIQEIDQPLASARTVRRTYPVSNARAVDLAEVLRSTVESGALSAAVAEAEEAAAPQETDAAAEQAPLQAALQSEEPPITIVADERTNILIVTAPMSVQPDIADLIAELDLPQPQVNVQVRIQEITRSATTDLGINLNAGAGSFAATFLGTGGLNFVFDPQRAISGLNLGAVLDAFERQALSRRVDDSNLTIVNNGEATIQSGGQLFISIPGVDENIERTIPYGFQVDISPQIAGDGSIILTVEARVEDIVGDATNPQLLNISTNNISSQVTLAPGQTVVLGGLFQNIVDEVRQSTPILGDLPIVGTLFRNTNISEDNTELLLIVTANVLE